MLYELSESLERPRVRRFVDDGRTIGDERRPVGMVRVLHRTPIGSFALNPLKLRLFLSSRPPLRLDGHPSSPGEGSFGRTLVHRPGIRLRVREAPVLVRRELREGAGTVPTEKSGYLLVSRARSWPSRGSRLWSSTPIDLERGSASSLGRRHVDLCRPRVVMRHRSVSGPCGVVDVACLVMAALRWPHAFRRNLPRAEATFVMQHKRWAAQLSDMPYQRLPQVGWMTARSRPVAEKFARAPFPSSEHRSRQQTPALKDIAEAIKVSGISKIDLSIDEVKLIVNSLVYDGVLEEVRGPAARFNRNVRPDAQAFRN